MMEEKGDGGLGYTQLPGLPREWKNHAQGRTTLHAGSLISRDLSSPIGGQLESWDEKHRDASYVRNLAHTTYQADPEALASLIPLLLLESQCGTVSQRPCQLWRMALSQRLLRGWVRGVRKGDYSCLSCKSPALGKDQVPRAAKRSSRVGTLCPESEVCQGPRPQKPKEAILLSVEPVIPPGSCEASKIHPRRTSLPVPPALFT
ncbi:hypothetical protein mRhiFer1_009613 [Rhinolophus ferrumequinum]|uniref:Uncharacterized protein n=1 Tax=Rhinolophus ferrumequinum TaxID=59479 RepID=A0A7J7ZQ48_RHIFE|nr:hypothetical protein mRhiFer1_009613 [Rhinolophus ferrumequinum]